LNGAKCNSGAVDLERWDAALCSCTDGFSGRRCEFSYQSSSSSSDRTAGIETTWFIIIIAAVGGLCVLVFCMMWVQRCRNRRDYALNSSQSLGSDPLRSKNDWNAVDGNELRTMSSSASVISTAPPYTAPGVTSTQYSTGVARKVSSPAAQVKDLQRRLEGGIADQEFQSLPKFPAEKTFRVCELPDNKGRNRYRDIRTYDDTRVRLMSEDNDYINANHITTSVGGKQFWYIATQGPLPVTTADFWQMTWEQQSQIIVMVTNDVESGRVKCERYWPDKEGAEKKFGSYAVKLQMVRSNDAYTMRRFMVKHTSTKESRVICQLQYTTWPDHGVPTDESYILAFVDELRSVRAKLMDSTSTASWPIVVHCSAGIGRTGVLMAIEIALAKIECGEIVDLKAILAELREQRYGLIQTPAQYSFVYSSVLQAVKNSELVMGLQG
jgi:protein tyrosine phosphatase